MAAYNLYDLTYRVSKELGIITEGSATKSGLVTVTYDQLFLMNRYEDSYFLDGWLWILYDAGGLGAAPQGEWAKITGFSKQTGAITHQALTVATGTGDKYAISTGEYPFHQIVMAINMVLGEIPVQYHDDTTIDTASDKTEYDLPSDMLDLNIEVWRNRNDDTTDNNFWFRTYDWYIHDDVTSAHKKLIFNNQPPEPESIRIKYWLQHRPLYLITDTLHDSVNLNRVIIPAVYKLLLWKKSQEAIADPVLDARIQEMYARSEGMKWKHQVNKDYIKLNTYGITDN